MPSPPTSTVIVPPLRAVTNRVVEKVGKDAMELEEVALDDGVSVVNQPEGDMRDGGSPTAPRPGEPSAPGRSALDRDWDRPARLRPKSSSWLSSSTKRWASLRM